MNSKNIIDEKPICPKCGKLHPDYSYLNYCECGAKFLYRIKDGKFITE